MPCGLVAKSFFTDKYQLCDASVEGNNCDTLTEANEVKIESDNIAWTSDVNFKFRNLQAVPDDACKTAPCSWENTQWLYMTDRK